MSGYLHHDLLNRPAGSARVWRYLDFAKLVDLIDQQALFFARADQMADPWEGHESEFSEAVNVAELDESLGAMDSTLRREVPDYRPFPRDRDGLLKGRRGHRRKFVRRVFLSCWHLAEHESAAMWDLYASREGRGVAIRSTFERMERALPSAWDHAIYAGTVRYLDYQLEVLPPGNSFYPFVHKRHSFEHERELRLLFDTRDDHTLKTGFAVPIDVAALIEQVRVAPTAPAWFADLVRRTVHRYGLDVAVEQSDLLTGPIE